MNILFLGGDARYKIIIEKINNKNINIDLLGYNSYNISNVNNIKQNQLNISKYDIVILPMSGINNDFSINSLDGKIKIEENIFKNIKKTCIIFTGLITKNLENTINHNQIISFLKDDEIKKSNTEITVNGILEKIKKYENSHICILGYGNIGKKLYEKIKNNKLNVGIIDEQDKMILQGNCFYTTDNQIFKKMVKQAQVIINTVPENIITEDILKNINDECYILDIASYPYGINQEILKKYNKNYELYLGIPAKYNPIESGLILSKKITNFIGGNIK